MLFSFPVSRHRRQAECHYNAWSGFGMVANCCGGATLASDVWTRTLATVGAANASDPHGTTAANTWDFSKWTADAVVINLGTNDHLGTACFSFPALFPAHVHSVPQTTIFDPLEQPLAPGYLFRTAIRIGR